MSTSLHRQRAIKISLFSGASFNNTCVPSSLSMSSKSPDLFHNIAYDILSLSWFGLGFRGSKTGSYATRAVLDLLCSQR